MSDDPFGLSGAGAAALSDDESASEEQAGSDDEQETTQAAVTEPAPAAPPAETQDAVTLGGEEDGERGLATRSAAGMIRVQRDGVFCTGRFCTLHSPHFSCVEITG